jgi:hypothetical protein
MADAEDLKSSGGNPVWVQFPPPVLKNQSERKRQNPINSESSASSKSTHSIASTHRETTDGDTERTEDTPDFTSAPPVPLPADLAEIVHAWNELPEAIRAAMLAVVRASKK